MLAAYKGYELQLLQGASVTLQLALVSLAFGLLIGLVLCAGKLSRHSALRATCYGIANVFRGLPELLVIFLSYFGVQIALNHLFGEGISLNPFIAGTLALSLIFGAYASEVFRAAFIALPKGQIEAALAFGLPRFRILLRIELPQVIQIALPSLGSLWLIMLKDTSMVAVIGLQELMRKAQIGTATAKDPFLFYGTAALLYVLISLASTMLLRLLEKRREAR